ncbi:MAG: hypothetical protein QOE33_2703 [Acidobacteriota bacterium]|nr:hypothetical protein [Acidobacteriota bacterium]
MIACTSLLLVGATLVFTRLPCPTRGCALTAEKRALALLKNRDTQPLTTDFDSRITLDALLAPGDDHARWPDSRASVIEGYVIDVQVGSIEAANCFSLTRRDVHIHVATRSDSKLRESVVVEVTPRSADAARARGEDWSLAVLKRSLVGRRCRFEGWLMFDREHAAQSENIAPGHPVNWRATAWELHPVTRIEVID